MAGFGDLFQKALYLGVGVASYAGEKASSALGDLRSQAQKLADELVERGEITTEDARRMVDDFVTRAQQQYPTPPSNPNPTSQQAKEPRRIEILDDDEADAAGSPEDVDALRKQVQSLEDELKRLQQ